MGIYGDEEALGTMEIFEDVVFEIDMRDRQIEEIEFWRERRIFYDFYELFLEVTVSSVF